MFCDPKGLLEGPETSKLRTMVMGGRRRCFDQLETWSLAPKCNLAPVQEALGPHTPNSRFAPSRKS